MLKCGDEFCSNIEVEDVHEYKKREEKLHPTWGGVCFWQSEGVGCLEYGGQTVRGGACEHCLVCGWSPCG